MYNTRNAYDVSALERWHSEQGNESDSARIMSALAERFADVNSLGWALSERGLVSSYAEGTVLAHRLILARPHFVLMRQQEDSGRRFASVEIKAADFIPPALRGDTRDRKWIQVMMCGSFKSHPSGPFEITPQTLREVVANFEQDGIPLVIDWEHASEQDPTSGSIPSGGAPAAGWIYAMTIHGDELWAQVEWTPKAKAQVACGEYKYVSPALRMGSKDRVTGSPIGARLSSVAITNQPYLRPMSPVTATDHPERQTRHGLATLLMAERGVSYAEAQVIAAAELRTRRGAR